MKDCMWFNARTLSLVPSRNSDAREILLRSLSPEYADGTLIRYVCNGLHVILHESHSLARYVARAHLRAPLACASQFDEGVA